MGGRNRLIVESLTPYQKVFVEAYLRTGGDGIDAAKLCALPGEPSEAAWVMLHTPAVVTAIQAAVALRIRTEGAALAQRLLTDIVRGTIVAAPGIRVDAAKTLLDRAGIVAAKAPEKPGERPLSDYSVDELQSLIPKLEAERAAAARDVTPETARETEQAIDADMFS
jgi:hypothetical protein